MLGRNAVGGLIIVLTALFSAGWAITLLYEKGQAVRLNSVANAVLSGAGFTRNPISEATLSAAELRHVCNPREIRASAIIRLRLYELAVNSADSRLVDGSLRRLRSSVQQAVKCVPTDGFVWFLVYWTAIVSGGEVEHHFDELRLSYKLAPYEGWIALRSPYVLAIYDVLPPDLQESARKEFASIVRTGLIRDAVRILKGAGWRHRDALLAGLDTVRVDLRLQLDRALRTEGLSAVVPGVAPREFRPWRP